MALHKKRNPTDCRDSVKTQIPPTGSGWMVQVLSTTERDICRGIGNSTSRQCVHSSSLFYRMRHLPGNRESHITAVCGWFKSFLPNETYPGESGVPHHG